MGSTTKSLRKCVKPAPSHSKGKTPPRKWKSGRPRKEAQQGAIEADNLLFELPYSEDELKALWRGFKSQPDATQVLADFGATSKADAAALIAKWTNEDAVDFTPPPASPDSWDW